MAPKTTALMLHNALGDFRKREWKEHADEPSYLAPSTRERARSNMIMSVTSAASGAIRL
jgi:hypothetical protein